MEEYVPITVGKFHSYLIGQNVLLREADVRQCLDYSRSKKPESQAEFIQRAYEKAVETFKGIHQKRNAIGSAGHWDGIERRMEPEFAGTKN